MNIKKQFRINTSNPLRGFPWNFYENNPSYRLLHFRFWLMVISYLCNPVRLHFQDNQIHHHRPKRTAHIVHCSRTWTATKSTCAPYSFPHHCSHHSHCLVTRHAFQQNVGHTGQSHKNKRKKKLYYHTSLYYNTIFTCINHASLLNILQIAF